MRPERNCVVFFSEMRRLVNNMHMYMYHMIFPKNIPVTYHIPENNSGIFRKDSQKSEINKRQPNYCLYTNWIIHSKGDGVYIKWKLFWDNEDVTSVLNIKFYIPTV